jgi:hypothetical protein
MESRVTLKKSCGHANPVCSIVFLLLFASLVQISEGDTKFPYPPQNEDEKESRGLIERQTKKVNGSLAANEDTQIASHEEQRLNSSLGMRLGMELKYGDWTIDLNFLLTFNRTNTSSLTMCEDRGARCLPDEIRFQINDPTSKLFRVLQDGHFSKLLASSSYASGFKINQNGGLPASLHSYLYERRRSSRRLLQAPIPNTEGVQKSQELVLLQVSLLVSLRQIKRGSFSNLLGLLTSVRHSARAALYDLTPRLSSLASVDAIKEQANLIAFLDILLDRMQVLEAFSQKVAVDIMNILYTLTQAAFCSKVAVPAGSESGRVVLAKDIPNLPPSVALKLGCLTDSLTDATYPLEWRLSAIQKIVNRTAVYVATITQGLLLVPLDNQDPLPLDADSAQIGAPDEAFQGAAAGPQFTCCTSTKVQILTQQRVQTRPRQCTACGKGALLLYWYKSIRLLAQKYKCRHLRSCSWHRS